MPPRTARARSLIARAAFLLVVCAAVNFGMGFSFGLGAATAAPQVFGWLEWSYLEPAHIRVKTKLDTGAKTSSIHATDIEVFDRDGNKWVRFRVPFRMKAGTSSKKRDVFFERPVVRRVRIKEHDRAPARRYVVNLDVCLGGITFTTPMTLADRSRFNYPLLLGRVALQGRAAVDPAQKYLSGEICAERSKP